MCYDEVRRSPKKKEAACLARDERRTRRRINDKSCTERNVCAPTMYIQNASTAKWRKTNLGLQDRDSLSKSSNQPERFTTPRNYLPVAFATTDCKSKLSDYSLTRAPYYHSSSCVVWGRMNISSFFRRIWPEHESQKGSLLSCTSQ